MTDTNTTTIQLETDMKNIEIEIEEKPIEIEVKKKYVRPKCIHGKDRTFCVDCGGGSICIHLKRKYECRICSPHHYCNHNKRLGNCPICNKSSFCIHSKKPKLCVICDGRGYCQHGKIKSDCVQCGTRKLCEHGKKKAVCTDCKGVSICEHGKRRTHCWQCGGCSICEHNIQKSTCKICNKNAYCEHGVIKSQCIPCDSASICSHKKIKTKCKLCKGGSVCEHDKLRTYCKPCGGSSLCKSSWCVTGGFKKYNGYCLSCCVNLFPDIPVYRNYKTKEADVASRVKEVFPDFSWVADKIIKDGCSKRRPDLLLDMITHIIIIEVDENKHSKYDSSCENKRLMELSQDLGHRPIVFIRFNPDAFTNSGGVKIPSCWKLNKLGVMSMIKPKEWSERILNLTNTIDYWINNINDKTIKIVEMFY